MNARSAFVLGVAVGIAVETYAQRSANRVKSRQGRGALAPRKPVGLNGRDSAHQESVHGSQFAGDSNQLGELLARDAAINTRLNHLIARTSDLVMDAVDLVRDVDDPRLLGGLRAALDPLAGTSLSWLLDALPARADDGSAASSGAAEAGEHPGKRFQMGEQVVHDDSSSVVPGVAPSGVDATVGAAGDAACVDSSARRVTETGEAA